MENLYNVGKFENSYLITDKKNVLIDTVSIENFEEFKKNVEKHIALSQIDFVIFTRTEPAAMGCVKEIIKANPEVCLIASVAGLRNLKEILNCEFNSMLAKENAAFISGENEFEFLMTPNLSWPDTMTVYWKNNRIVFSGNLFCENIDKEMFSPVFFKKASDRIQRFMPDRILPAYGDEKDNEVFSEYGEMCLEQKDRLCIIYSSYSGRTKKLADMIKDNLNNTEAIMIDANECSEKEALEYIDNSKALAFGTFTMNHNAGAAIIRLLSNINITRNEGKKVMVFGSYGWSGEGVHIIANLVNNMKMRVFKKPYLCIFEPENTEDLKKYVKDFEEVLQDA